MYGVVEHFVVHRLGTGTSRNKYRYMAFASKQENQMHAKLPTLLIL
jgi:hypothetical protein